MSETGYRVRHVTHQAFSGKFQHHKEGCLCHECPHYLSCRLSFRPVLRTPDMPWDNDKPLDIKTEKLTAAEKLIIEVLKSHVDVLNGRQISIRTGISRRHVTRCLKRLLARGIIKRIIEVRKEIILKTTLTHQEMVDIANRFVLSPDMKESLGTGQTI